MRCDETTRLIDAYIDGELSASDASAVGGHVDACVHCLRRIQAREVLGELIRGLPYFASPEQLRTTIVDRRRPIRSLTHWAAAAMVVAAAAGGAGGGRAWWRTHIASVVAEQVMTRHVHALATQHLVDVRSSDQHTVKPWFQGKLDFAPLIADLADAGFPLIGGRIDTIAGRPVAAVVYERRRHVITAFVSAADEHVPAEYEQTVRGFHEKHWVQEGICFWIVSDLNAQELTDFVELLRARAM
jgi:anti-sigma factor (TIGR02949 family)